MKKFISLIVMSILLAACAPQATATPTATASLTATSAPTKTPIPTPTLHPNFIALQETIAASGGRFTLDGATGLIYDGENPVSGITVSVDGTITLEIDGEIFTPDPEAMSFDDQEGITVEENERKLKWAGDGWEAVARLPNEAQALVDQGMVWDEENGRIYDPNTGLLMGAQLPNGEWKTDFDGFFTISTKEGESIKFPIYADGEVLLQYLESSDVIRDDKNITKQGGAWVQDKVTRPKIYLSRQLARPDDRAMVVYVQTDGRGRVSVQHILEPGFHFVDDLQTFFVFKLSEFVDLDSGVSLSLVAVPVPGGEQFVFVLGTEQGVIDGMRESTRDE